MLHPALLGLLAAAAPLTPSFPPQHPFLAVTAAEVAGARDKAARLPWARRALDAVTAEAKGLAARPLGPVPAKGDTKHWEVADHLFKVALGHAFGGERAQAEWVRDGLLAYADAYPGWPLTNLRCKAFTQSSLYEAMWVVNLAQAYDLVADSGVFTAAQRKHVEDDLLRASAVCFKVDDYAADPRARDLHFRCYNFQAWHLSAVGLVGLATRDPALAGYALDSPYGFPHLVAHDIRDDGMFWERSPGYHRFVISALLPLCEAMRHCGVDLYHLSVPPIRGHDEDCHYDTDTSDQPKSLAMMFTAPLYLSFPDTSFPALGDSDRGPLRGDWTDLLAWDQWHDPQLAWLLGRDVPLQAGQVTTGQAGFLHYYRYHYRYTDVLLDGRPPVWARTDATYKLGDNAITVEDAGVSQPDHYLLSETMPTDFVLEWTLTRVVDSGAQDRAWVVWHVDPRDSANRLAFIVTGYCPEVGRAYRFRLEVKGDQGRLLRDGQLVVDKPIVYGRTPDWHWLTHDPPETSPPALPLRATFGNTGRYENGCSLLPATGVAVLREADGDFTAKPDSTAVALSYGPYGGGHGHPDKLSIVVYAGGRQWLPLFGSMPYETHWKAEWTAQTVSHNTVVLDETSQKPTGERNVQWPADSAADRVLGRLEAFEPALKRASGGCETAYPGVTLGRAVQVVDHLVVDDYRVTAREPHQIDYVLHVDGDFVAASPKLPARSGALGAKCGYQLLQQQAGDEVSGPAMLTFASGKQRLRLWLVAMDDDPSEVILADGLTNSPEGHAPTVVVRRRAATMRYVTVVEPVRAGREVQAVRPRDGRLTITYEGGAVREVALP